MDNVSPAGNDKLFKTFLEGYMYVIKKHKRVNGL